MWSNKYICAQVSSLCLCLISIIVILDYTYQVLPFSTIFVLLYLILGLFLTIWLSFVILQNVLNQIEPFDVKKHQKYKNFVLICTNLLSKMQKSRIPFENSKIGVEINQNVETRIEQFVSAIEAVYIRKWYITYISTDQHFLKETSNILDVVVRRCLQFSKQINSDKLIHGGLIILLKHVKEYRKAATKCKTNGGSLEQQYRYSHVASNNHKAFEYFTHQITAKLLRHFINWELYNSFACQCLISIIAKKLISYLLSSSSSPAFINMKIFKSTATSTTDQLISISDVDHAIGSISAGSTLTTIENNSLSQSHTTPSQPLHASAVIMDSTTPLHVHPTSDQLVTEPVKIYESNSAARKDNHHTWKNSSDLECISIGQDLLDYTNISRLWTGASAVVAEDQFANLSGNMFNSSGHGHLTGHNTTKNIVMPGGSQSSSIALHKIGDLQDEAAGVVEGILDFGMAGIRKGLRLTGLQPEPSECDTFSTDFSKYPVKPNELVHFKHTTAHPAPADLESDNVWVNPLTKTDCSPSFDGDILLERSPLVGYNRCIPTMEILHVIDDSPEPEYDDNADLATTAAKLRSLLAQRTTESAAATPAASPMCMTPMDPAGTSIEDLSEVDGALPSMYKAWGWARTATGVFQNTIKNTIKTSLEPASDGETDRHMLDTHTSLHFAFVEGDAQSAHLAGHVKKLLMERRVFCTIDNAYEAIDSVLIAHECEELHSSSFEAPRKLSLSHRPPHIDDDELDNFDKNIPMAKAAIDLMCELLEDGHPSLVKENVVRISLMMVGTLIEEQLQQLGHKLIEALNGCVDVEAIPTAASYDNKMMPLATKLDKMVEICVESVPNIFKCALPEESTKSILKLLLESLQSQKINQDSTLQILELVASEIITAASQITPAYSA